MATIRKRGKRFHVQVRRAGFPTRTESFGTRKKAEDWAKSIEGSMVDGRHFRSTEARRRTVGEAIDRYIAEVAPRLKDHRNPKIRLAWWKRQIGTRKLSELTPALAAQYRGKLQIEAYSRARPDAKRTTLKEGEKPAEFKRGDSTANRYMACMSRLCNVARREWHWLETNPFESVARFREGRGAVRFLSNDERDRLLAQTVKNRQLHVFTVIALSTAARAGELQNLIWRDVDLGEGRLTLRQTKNSDGRSAWLHGEALRLLKEHAAAPHEPDDRVFRSSKGRVYRYTEDFTTAAAAANVSGIVFHTLRHSAATYLAREGATEQQLKAIGGWKSGVVSRYVHLAAEDAREVVKKMNAKILGDGQADEEKA